MDDTRPTELHERQPAEESSGTTATPAGHTTPQQQSAPSVIHHLTQTLLNLLPPKSVHIHSSGHIYANKWLVKRQMRIAIKSPY